MVPTRFKLGKHAPKFHAKTLFYRNYHVAVPPAPLVCYYNLRLRQSAWGMYGNDQLGDCAIADPAHQILLETSYTRKMPNPTDAEVLAAYSAVSGYNGDPSTDNGCAMTDVWNYWSTTGIAGDKIAGWVQIDPTNLEHVRQAIFAFGGVHVGVQLPNSAMDQFNAGQDWKVVADDGGIAGGHAIYVPGYVPGYICPVTWGRAIRASLAWLARYCDEMYATVSLDWLTTQTGLSPSHIDLATLKQDLLAVQEGTSKLR
jgi:hypothetical protein